MKTTKIALGIDYDGSPYSGWQRQQNALSVQACLEKALTRIADEPINVFCAGRTDTGVHALGQVVHFETQATRNLSAWIMGVNTHLPPTIAVTWVKSVADTFHARFSATARRYLYVILNRRHRPAILCHGLTHIHLPLDVELMHHAAQYLVGKHDFSSFRASQCQSYSPWRSIIHLNVTRQGQYVIVDVKANAFLHHMVRNIVGSLVKVGAGEQSGCWIEQLLLQKERTAAAATAKPNGLYLHSVDYPSHFELPSTEAHFFHSKVL